MLGTWAGLLDSPPEELAATSPVLLSAVGVRPYLSLHGIDRVPATRTGSPHLPQAIVEVWPDHGHYPFLVDRSAFLDRLADFERDVRA